MRIDKILLISLFIAGLVASTPTHADDRVLIEIPVESQELLMAKMRVLVDHLDDLLAAIAEGDFVEAGRISEYKLGFGHARWEKMLAEGVPEKEIQAQRIKMLKWRKQGGRGQGKGGSIFGQGVGRLMPEEVREMGQLMHAAAGEVSIAAKKAGTTPGVEDYKAVINGVQEMTSVCRACHASFKIR